MPEEAVAVFSRNLRSTAAVARAFGARTLLVAQTARVRKGREAFDRTYLESWTPGLDADGYLDGVARYNAAARALADEGVARFVDPFGDGSFTDDDFADPVHFSPSGSRRFAARLAVELGPPGRPGAAPDAANIPPVVPVADRKNG
jgi:lysophospholipase L1-like esterase